MKTLAEFQICISVSLRKNLYYPKNGENCEILFTQFCLSGFSEIVPKDSH